MIKATSLQRYDRFLKLCYTTLYTGYVAVFTVADQQRQVREVPPDRPVRHPVHDDRHHRSAQRPVANHVQDCRQSRGLFTGA